MRKLLALLLFTVPVAAQVPVALSPTPRMQFFSEVTPSVPLAGGKVCTFNAGTTTPAATYTDISGTFQNTNPIILDSSGFATIYLANQEYKFIVYDSTGNNACPNTGVQQWSQDNVSAFQPVVGTQTIIFAGVTSDPVGQAGMVDYRTDLGRLSFFNSAWDRIPGLATVDTFTNKTLDISANTLKNSTNTAGHFPRNNGTQYVDSAIQSQDVPGVSISVPNIGGVAPIVNSLVVLNGPPASVQLAPTGATSGVVGIWLGNSTVQITGAPGCNFDGGTTANDYIQISSTVAGDCHDAGGTFPSSGQVIGRVLTNQISAGAYTMILFNAEIRPNGPVPAFVNLTAQGANIASTPIFTPATNGFYRFSCYTVVTQAATTSSTLPTCNAIWTDADTSVAQTLGITAQATGNTVGQNGLTGFVATLPIFAKGTVAISYSTSGYASVGATPMQYAIHIRLEGPF